MVPHYQKTYFYLFLTLVHPCDKDDNAGCAQRCIKERSGFVCECSEGYNLGADGKTCNKGKIITYLFLNLLFYQLMRHLKDFWTSYITSNPSTGNCLHEK